MANTGNTFIRKHSSDLVFTREEIPHRPLPYRFYFATSTDTRTNNTRDFLAILIRGQYSRKLPPSGRIAPSSSDFLEYLNTKTVVRKDILSSGENVPPLGYAGFSRACDFTSPDKTCAQFKPIGKIVVAETSVYESSSASAEAVSSADAG